MVLMKWGTSSAGRSHPTVKHQNHLLTVRRLRPQARASIMAQVLAPYDRRPIPRALLL